MGETYTFGIVAGLETDGVRVLSDSPIRTRVKLIGCAAPCVLPGARICSSMSARISRRSSSKSEQRRIGRSRNVARGVPRASMLASRSVRIAEAVA
jgi:hypothetical protein